MSKKCFRFTWGRGKVVCDRSKMWWEVKRIIIYIIIYYILLLVMKRQHKAAFRVIQAAVLGVLPPPHVKLQFWIIYYYSLYFSSRFCLITNHICSSQSIFSLFHVKRKHFHALLLTTSSASHHKHYRFTYSLLITSITLVAIEIICLLELPFSSTRSWSEST